MDNPKEEILCVFEADKGFEQNKHLSLEAQVWGAWWEDTQHWRTVESGGGGEIDHFSSTRLPCLFKALDVKEKEMATDKGNGPGKAGMSLVFLEVQELPEYQV